MSARYNRNRGNDSWRTSERECEDFEFSIKNNKHCWQLFHTPLDCDLGVQELCMDLDLKTAKWRQYYKRMDKEKSVRHRGQLKLLFAEIRFLLQYSKDDDTVLYAGAAPGTHLKILSNMFPKLKFVLVDPANFTVKENEPYITIRQCMFTDEIAQEFAGRSDVLFISDIRSTDPRVDPEKENERLIKKDMDDQARWHQIIRPRYSILKFRLPWSPGVTHYLKGTINLPIWGPESTTESRLVVAGDCNETAKYDNIDYEGKMFYFNTTTRVARYPHNYHGESGLDHCYDCAATVRLLSDYKETFRITTPIPQILKNILNESFQPAFDRENVDKNKRYNNIDKNQRVNGKLAYRA